MSTVRTLENTSISIFFVYCTITVNNYIALEVEFGNRITIAPHEGELTEYNYVVNNIRHFIKERHGEADA